MERNCFWRVCLAAQGYDLPKSQRIEGNVPVIGSNGLVGYHGVAKSESPGVMVGRSGSVGKTFYAAGPHWPLNTALYVESFHGNNQRFVEFFCRHFDFSRFATGVSVPTLNRNIVHKVSVNVPDIPEQKDIAGKLSQLDSKIKHHQSKKTALQDLFRTTLNKLMTGDIRVADLGYRR